MNNLELLIILVLAVFTLLGLLVSAFNFQNAFGDAVSQLKHDHRYKSISWINIHTDGLEQLKFLLQIKQGQLKVERRVWRWFRLQVLAAFMLIAVMGKFFGWW